jgi:hypothetical protein
VAPGILLRAARGLSHAFSPSRERRFAPERQIRALAGARGGGSIRALEFGVEPDAIVPEQSLGAVQVEAALPGELSWRRFFALHDVILFFYLGALRLLVQLAAHGPARSVSLMRLDGLLLLAVGGCLVARGGWVLGRRARARLYRLTLLAVVVGNYLVLRDILPLVRPDAVDAQLLAIDRALFGVEPALWLQRFNQRPVVEWFSFFYFSYFFICAAWAVTVLFAVRAGRHTTEFAIGCTLVFCVGQLGYLLVPGYGPVHHMASSFDAPLDGGLFWNWVQATVRAGGALKDIFPSLHTAGPSWFALYAWRHARRGPRWRAAALVTTFFAVHIVVSTMLLRWHYAIDVAAGLALAGAAAWLAPRLAAFDHRARCSFGAADAWSFGLPTPDRG